MFLSLWVLGIVLCVFSLWVLRIVLHVFVSMRFDVFFVCFFLYEF
jgi:hypothetical protein